MCCERLSTSTKVAQKFIQKGVERIFLFPGGYVQWIERQYPVEKNII